MSGPKLITDFPLASGLSYSLLLAVGDPNTGVLYKTTIGSMQSLGFQGFQGPQGIQGQGNQGPTGIQGYQGVSGSIAITINGLGSAGEQGLQGITGSQGLQGFQGSTGSVTIFIESIGYTGSTGVQGRQGPQGPIATGVQGATGTPGATGVGFLQTLIYTVLTTSPTYSLITGPFSLGTAGLVEVNVVGVNSGTGYDFISGKKVMRYFYSNTGTFSVGPISDLLPTERSGGFSGATWSIISDGASSVLVRLIGTATASVKWLIDYKYVEVVGDF